MTDLETACRELVEDLETQVNTLRGLAEDKREKASDATSAQSRKYNQAAAYAYTIRANSIEQTIAEHTEDTNE